jgi:hypothetical protein
VKEGRKRLHPSPSSFLIHPDRRRHVPLAPQLLPIEGPRGEIPSCLLLIFFFFFLYQKLRAAAQTLVLWTGTAECRRLSRFLCVLADAFEPDKLPGQSSQPAPWPSLSATTQPAVLRACLTSDPSPTAYRCLRRRRRNQACGSDWACHDGCTGTTPPGRAPRPTTAETCTGGYLARLAPSACIDRLLSVVITRSNKII